MKTLEQAYREFNFDTMVQQHLAGTPDALNAYTECCGRFLGQNRIALIWEGKMARPNIGLLNNWLRLQDNWLII